MTPLLKAYATTLREAYREMGPGPLFGAYRTCLSAAVWGLSELDPGLAYVHDSGALRFYQRRALQNLTEAQAIRGAAKACAKGRADQERLVMNAMAWEHAANEFKHLRARLAAVERDLAVPVAQLRHLYENLVREGKREIADGLLSPQIRALEKMMTDEEVET